MATLSARLALVLGLSGVAAQDYCTSHEDCPSEHYCDIHSMWCASQHLQFVLSCSPAIRRASEYANAARFLQLYVRLHHGRDVRRDSGVRRHEQRLLLTSVPFAMPQQPCGVYLGWHRRYNDPDSGEERVPDH